MSQTSSKLVSIVGSLLLGLAACAPQGDAATNSTRSGGTAGTAGTAGGGGTAGGATAGDGNGTAGGGTAGGATAGNGNGTAGNGNFTGNPFAGAVMYVSPDYATEVDAYAKTLTGADQTLANAAKAFPTGIWMDRIAAIAGGASNGNRLGLTGHLDAALTQAQAAGKPAVMVVVVYDLPNRDCHSKASNGELQGAAGLTRYKTDYIDGLVKAFTSKPEYTNVRLALIIEPDSLPNLVTNVNNGYPDCDTAASLGVYTDGITYAIQKLSTLPNAALYLDVAHAGWLGWTNNMAKAVPLYMNLINTATNNKPSLIRGLATDIANYTPLQEPFVKPTDQALLSGSFYQSNPIFDEATYVSTLNSQFKAAGFPTDMGFIIDTSRSGWKQVNDGTPIDKRKARGNWCNVNGAGIGVRPVASPAGQANVDALYFVKPPGESDGISMLENPTNAPDAEGKRFDPDCDPTNSALDAMTGAPGAGHWFSNQFLMLLHNATPALP